MGLISTLSAGAQGVWDPMLGAYRPAPQQAQHAASPQQAQPQQPRRGLLSRAAEMTAPSPMTPTNTPQLTQSLPQMLPQSAPGIPGAPGGPPQVQQTSWNDRLTETLGNPLFQTGLAMWTAGMPNGGGPQAAMRNVMQIQQQHAMRQRQQRSDQREDEQLGAWREDRQRVQDQRGRYEQWVSSLPPEQQAAARVNPEAAFEAFSQQQAMANAPITPFQQEQLRLEELGIQETAAARRAAASDASRYGRVQYQTDIRRLASMGEAVNFAQVSVLPRLQRAEQIVARLSEIGGMDNPLSADRRIQLSQLGQFSQEARGLLQELRRIQTEFTVEDARKLAPVSNTDFGRLQEINVNGNMTVDAAYRILQSMRQGVERGVHNYTAAAQWTDEHGGLTGTLDSQGRTFEQVYGEGLMRSLGSEQSRAGLSQSAPAGESQGQRFDALPTGQPEGATAIDHRTGREFVFRNGAWALRSTPSYGRGRGRDRQ